MTVAVGCLIGSLSTQSINRGLAAVLLELAPPELAMTEIQIGDLPLYNYDDDEAIPSAARRFKAAIEACDALLFVTPEYNRSIPGALKNALDTGSRPWGSNSWAGRRAGILGTGLNGAGTAVAQAHLRGILGALELDVMGGPEICLPWTADVLSTETTLRRLQRFLDAFASFVTPAPARDGTPAWVDALPARA